LTKMARNVLAVSLPIDWKKLMTVDSLAN